MPVPADAATAARRGRARPALLAAGALVIAAATGAIVVRARSGSGAPPGERLVLADVENVSGDTIFDRALLAAATTALRQSAHIALYPRARLPDVYRRMGLADTSAPLDFDLAREVAERDRARFVLGLRVEREGAGYRLGARLADVARDREPGRWRSRAVERDEVVAALDDLLGIVRRALGESRRDVAERRAPLPLVTTTSLEALRSYADGSHAWQTGDYRRAHELWLRAVDLDTGFAMALGALGASYYYVHDRANGERYFAAALARPERLSEWERLTLRMRLASYRGDRDSALVLTGLVARRYPTVATWYDYGSQLMRSGRSDEAIEALRRALALDSTYVNAWINLATTYSGMGRYEDAVRSYHRARSLDSAALARGNINHEYGGALVRLGRYDDAEQAYRGMLSSPNPADRALAMRSLGLLALWEGRLPDAARAFRQAAAATAGAPLSEMRNRLFLSGVHRAANRMGEANAELDRALALARSPLVVPSMLGMLAYACWQLDRPRDVERVAAMLRARVDPRNADDAAAVALVDGMTWLDRRQPDSALVHLRRASAFPWRVPPLMLVAEAFEALGQRDSTRAALEEVLADKGFGTEGQDDWLRAPLLIGNLLLQAGDTAGAIRRYEEMLARWREAPIDAPDVASARGRLGEIRGR